MSAQRGWAQDPGTPGQDDTALAVPRVAPRGSAGLALPQPLPPSDAARLRRIFALQSRGSIPAALRETEALDAADPLIGAMLGHVLAQRYLGPATRPGAPELQSWLDRWSRQPDAPAIHSLLLIRLPRGSARPPAPTLARLEGVSATDAGTIPVPEETEAPGEGPVRRPALDAAVRAAARGAPGAAARLIGRTAGLSPAYASLLRGEAAQILFIQNRDQEAYDIAAPGIGCGGSIAGCASAARAGLQGGLAAWRLGRLDQARPMFEAAWLADVTTPSLRAAAAFWAARTWRTQNDTVHARLWLQRAAADGRTFYGQLARRSLGLGLLRAADGGEMLAEADIDAVAATPEGMRAFALLQIGQTGRADAELRLLWPAARGNTALGRAIMLVAEKAGLAELAAQLADLVQATDGRPRDRTRFPIPRLQPASGFIVDPALVYALARTESNFDPSMVSPAGARGLMQIMPETARFISGEGDSQRLQLHDPAVNLDVGQRYVAHLAGLDIVGGDLIRMLGSYNAGPGNFLRWSQGIRDGGDPLLFIESIPVDETRAFIPRVLAYNWIYAARLRRPDASLTELAQGRWPRFAAPSGAVPALVH